MVTKFGASTCTRHAPILMSFAVYSPLFLVVAKKPSLDVTNPLCGPTGASAIYGPQKGAEPQDVVELERALARFAAVAAAALARDAQALPLWESPANVCRVGVTRALPARRRRRRGRRPRRSARRRRSPPRGRC